MSASAITRVPVFAFPNNLKFFLGKNGGHTQILTLYSPYDFAVRYTVCCQHSIRDKYKVPNAEGKIPPRSSVELPVTHLKMDVSNCNVVDKFKIYFKDAQTKTVFGSKTIESVLLMHDHDSRSMNTGDDFEFQSNYDTSSRSFSVADSSRTQRNLTVPNGSGIMSGIIILVCVVILFLPTVSEVTRSTNLPDYLHVSHKCQLVAAMILGIYLCIVIRT